MNPGVSRVTTGVFPQAAANSTRASMVSWLVPAPRATSTSCITGAGLKKCMPATRSGERVAAAMAVIDSVLVLLAKIAGGGQIESSCANSLRLSSRSSSAASITTPDPAKTWKSSLKFNRAMASDLAFRLRWFSMYSRARNSASAETSASATACPAYSAVRAIPAPIVPAPSTPIRCSSDAAVRIIDLVMGKQCPA